MGLLGRLAQRLLPRLGTFYHHAPRELRLPRRYSAKPLSGDIPVISIVTPTLNPGRFLERTIRSVLDQGYGRLEYVVQDGGSSDDSLKTLERFSPLLHACTSGPDRGQADAINMGFAKASGEILSFLNSDDLLLVGSLAYVARYFAAHPDVDVIYSHRVIVDEHDREIGRWILPRHKDAVLPWADFIPQETMFWRRRVWGAVGGLDPRFHSCLDWDLILRFRDVGARFVRVPRFLAAFRAHADQKLARMADNAIREATEIRRRVHGRHVTQAEIVLNIWPYVAKHVLLDRLYRMRLLRY